MMRLLKIEWNKVYSYRAFRILVGIYLVSFIALPYTMEGIPFLRNWQQLFEFPIIWFSYYFGAEFLSLALAILVITLTTNEYSNRTFRQHVIDGMSRRELFAGKMLLMGAMALLLSVIFAINGYIAGTLNAFIPEPELTWTKAGYIPGFTMHTLGIMAFSFFVANLLRRSGLAIFAFLAWIFPIELIIRGVLVGVVKDGGMISSRLPIHVIYSSNVQTKDIFSDVAMLDINALIPNGLGWENLAWKAIWIAVFSGLSYWMILRRDL